MFAIDPSNRCPSMLLYDLNSAYAFTGGTGRELPRSIFLMKEIAIIPTVKRWVPYPLPDRHQCMLYCYTSVQYVFEGSTCAFL